MFELGWVVGLIEGEGCPALYGNSPGISVSQSSKSPDPVERIHSLLGGHLYKQQNTYPEHVWGAYGSRAVGILMTIYPHMSFRRQEQIRKVLDRWRQNV